jgi:hypothetical protein
MLGSIEIPVRREQARNCHKNVAGPSECGLGPRLQKWQSFVNGARPPLGARFGRLSLLRFLVATLVLVVVIPA